MNIARTRNEFDLTKGIYYLPFCSSNTRRPSSSGTPGNRTSLCAAFGFIYFDVLSQIHCHDATVTCVVVSH